MGSLCALVCVSVGALGLGEGIELDSLRWGVRVGDALELEKELELGACGYWGGGS